jgi:hypothetical protein
MERGEYEGMEENVRKEWREENMKEWKKMSERNGKEENGSRGQKGIERGE